MNSTLKPLTEGEISGKEKQAALELLILLKEKRGGSIKGRVCTDERKKWTDSPKEDSTSTTVSLEVVLITFLVDAYEEQEYAIIDVTGVFLMADQDKVINMALRGKLAKLMVKIAP